MGVWRPPAANEPAPLANESWKPPEQNVWKPPLQKEDEEEKKRKKKRKREVAVCAQPLVIVGRVGVSEIKAVVATTLISVVCVCVYFVLMVFSPLFLFFYISDK